MIKKLFFSILLLGLISQTATAQIESFMMGFKFGVNFADIEGEETDGLDPRTSIHIGLAAEFPVNEIIAIHPELLYSFQGVSFDSELPNFDTESLQLDYIYLPVMVKYYPFYVVPGFSVETGPQVGYLVRAISERKNTVNGITETSDVDIKEFTSEVDFGVNFGLGYHFEIGAFVQARYSLGLGEIFEDAPIHHSVFQFSTGFKF